MSQERAGALGPRSMIADTLYSPCHLPGDTGFLNALEEDPRTARVGVERELPRGSFPATRWSLVAQLGGDEERARGALQDLCQIYWFPLYAYARRTGRSAHDAEDLTQAFFAKVLEKGYFDRADKSRGKLRNFLLITFKRFVSDRVTRANAQRRGGGTPVISIDSEAAEARYERELADADSPETLFERRWALTLLDTVLSALRDEYSALKKTELFDELKPFLAWNSTDSKQADAAKKLGISGNNVRVQVFRLRRRYGDLLRQHIADTVETEDEVAGEIDHLMRVLG